MSTRSRWPGRVFDHGSEPDPRFSLANERTFLAWLRTGLALVAGGVALDQFVAVASGSEFVQWLAIATIGAGGGSIASRRRRRFGTDA